MNNITHTIKQNKDTTILQFNVNELKVLPLKVAMKTLEIIERNNQGTGLFIEFNPETQEFIDQNRITYKKEVQQESENFKKLSNIYFNEMTGPLFIYGERVLEIVSQVYAIEPLVFDVKVRVPKIIHTLTNEEESNVEKVLIVKNTQELIEKFGRAITLHTLILFKEHLNYEYQVINKSSKKPYGISKNIKSLFFNKEKGSHDFLEKLTGKNYLLESMFDNHMKHINTPEEILELIIIRENLKNCLNNPNDKYKIQLNGSSEDDVWYLKNNIVHREGDLPARETKDGAMWYKNGLVHRDGDLPSYVNSYSKAWSKNGLDHRDGDLPAKIIRDDESQFWYKEGKKHRVGAPAYIQKAHSHYMSTEEWWHEDKKHRIDGPAVTIGKDLPGKEVKEWWLNGVQIPEKDFGHEVSKRILNEKLNEELITLEVKGKKMKI